MLLKEIQTTMSGVYFQPKKCCLYMGTGFKVYQVQVLLDFDAEHNQELQLIIKAIVLKIANFPEGTLSGFYDYSF